LSFYCSSVLLKLPGILIFLPCLVILVATIHTHYNIIAVNYCGRQLFLSQASSLSRDSVAFAHRCCIQYEKERMKAKQRSTEFTEFKSFKP